MVNGKWLRLNGSKAATCYHNLRYRFTIYHLLFTIYDSPFTKRRCSRWDEFLRLLSGS